MKHTPFGASGANPPAPITAENTTHGTVARADANCEYLAVRQTQETRSTTKGNRS